MHAVTEMSKGIEVPVVLRHIGSHGIAADPSLRFEQPEIEPVRVLMQRPGHPQSRDSRTR